MIASFEEFPDRGGLSYSSMYLLLSAERKASSFFTRSNPNLKRRWIIRPGKLTLLSRFNVEFLRRERVVRRKVIIVNQVFRPKLISL